LSFLRIFIKGKYFNMKKFSLISIVVLLAFISTVFAAYYSGTINSKNNFVYLAKFCYSGHIKINKTGSISYIFNSTTYNTTQVNLYYIGESTGGWTTVEDGKLSCANKTALSHYNFTTFNTGTIGSLGIRDNNGPLYWYLAVSNCESTLPVNLIYEITFLNPGGWWEQQFSFDEQGLLQMFITFFIIFTLGALFHGYTSFSLYQRNAFHTTVQIFTVCLLFEWFTFFLYMVHYATYGNDGVGSPSARNVAEFVDMMFQILMMFLLCGMAKGWGISNNDLDHKLYLIGGVVIFAILYLSLYIWQLAGLNPALVIYYYDSAPGYIIISLRLIVFGYWAYTLYNSYKSEKDPTNRNFYFIFGIVYTVWFLILPLIVLIALGIPPWYKEITVDALYYTFNTIAFIAFLILFFKYFKKAAIYENVSGEAVPITTSYDKL